MVVILYELAQVRSRELWRRESVWKRWNSFPMELEEVLAQYGGQARPSLVLKEGLEERGWVLVADDQSLVLVLTVKKAILGDPVKKEITDLTGIRMPRL